MNGFMAVYPARVVASLDRKRLEHDANGDVGF
jgi:hypothetical protein